MGKSIKKIIRKKYQFKKKHEESILSSKINMFDKLENNCLICNKTFDKRDKEMVTSWNVVVTSDKIKLYCPTCWNRANTIIDTIKESIHE